MTKVVLLANAKVQGTRYKAGDTVDVKKKELLEELRERGLIDGNAAANTAEAGE